MLIPVELLAAFFAASVLLALSPGPDNLFVLTQSALRGRGAGLLVTLGLCTGLIFHTTAVALGIAAVFKASAVAFTVLKLVGAAYLLYLAWGAFRAGGATTEIGTNKDAGLTAGQLYRRGIFMNITNPKVSIFFLAFMPQFADPARGSLTLQIMLLGVVFIISTLLVFGGIALLAGSLGQWLGRSAKAQRVMNKVAGGIFAALALRLAMAER